MKKTMIPAALLVLLLLLVGCGVQKATKETKEKTEQPTESETTPTEGPTTETPAGDLPGLTVWTLKAGDADALVLQVGEHVVVIDTGDKDLTTPLTDKVKELGAQVDVLVISHYDEDHVGGVKKLLKKAKVESVYLPEYEKGTNAVETQGYLTEAGLTLTVVEETLSFTLDDARFTLLPTSIFFKVNDTPSNESSLALLVEYGENRLLFTGDAEKRRLPELIEQLGDQTKVDFLKVPRHGKSEEGTEAFLTALSPKVAVVCCGSKSKTDPEVAEYLGKCGTKLFYTCDGTLKVTSDGRRLTAEVGE